MVTAAHCVFDINDSRQYVSSLDFAPGESSQNSLPYGTAQWSSVRVLSQFTSQVGALYSAQNLSVSAVACLLSHHQIRPSQTAFWLLLRFSSCTLITLELTSVCLPCSRATLRRP